MNETIIANETVAQVNVGIAGVSSAVSGFNLGDVINSPLFSYLVKDFIVILICFTVVFLLLALYIKFESDFPRRHILAKEGIWKRMTRRLYGNMLVNTNDIYRAVIFGDVVVGAPEDTFMAEPFEESKPFGLGKTIVFRYICRLEKGILIPYTIDDKNNIIQLSNKYLAVKEIAARWVNAIRKAEAFSKKANPLMAMLFSYAPYIIFMFLFLVFFYFIASGLQTSMEKTWVVVGQVVDKLDLLVNATKGG